MIDSLEEKSDERDHVTHEDYNGGDATGFRGEGKGGKVKGGFKDSCFERGKRGAFGEVSQRKRQGRMRIPEGRLQGRLQ